MSLIIKSSVSKEKDKKQIYTWAACIFVAIFLLSIAVPVLSGKKEDRSSKYKDAYYDLANMPFSSDAAEQELLASAKYQDIGKADLINTLFSKKEKEDRQAEDEELGPPAPPDEDYQQAANQQDAAARAAARSAAASSRYSAPARPVNTQAGSLRGGSMASGGGGGGFSTTIWQGSPKQNTTATTAGKNMTAQQIAKDLRAGGRGSAYMDVYAKSVQAGKEKDAQAAAHGAADAFADGKAGDADLNTEMEKAMAELGEDAVVDPNSLRSANPDGWGQMKDNIDKQKQNQKDAQEKCKSLFSGNGGFWGSMSCIGDKLGSAMLDGAGNWATYKIFGDAGKGGGCPKGKSTKTTEKADGTKITECA